MTPRDLFHRHLDWLTAHCHLVPLRHLFEHRMLQEERRPRVALTFDDGHADNYHCVYPLLQRYRAPAAFFVVTGLLARDPEVVRRFPALRALEWGQVREMRDMGMTFGSHSHSHPNLADLEPAGVAGELERSKHVLEQELGAAVTIMAYPFGVPGRHVTGVAVRAAAAAGYELAAAMTCRGVGAGDRMAIPRFCVVRDSVETLRQKVLGAWDVVGVWQERMPLTLARSVERLLGIDYAAAARRAVQDGTASWP